MSDKAACETVDCFHCDGSGSFPKNVEGDSERCATCHGKGLLPESAVHACRSCDEAFGTEADLFGHQASRHDY